MAVPSLFLCIRPTTSRQKSIVRNGLQSAPFFDLDPFNNIVKDTFDLVLLQTARHILLSERFAQFFALQAKLL